MACINAANGSPGHTLTPMTRAQGVAAGSRCDCSMRHFRLRHGNVHGVIATHHFALRPPWKRVERYCEA